MNDKLRPALIGGVSLGVLSALPLLNFPNICCCAWAILGGALAAYLYIKRSATSVTAGEGALLGLMAGLIGAAVYFVLAIPLGFLTSELFSSVALRMVENIDPGQAEMVRSQIEMEQSRTLVERLPWSFLVAFLGAVPLVIFSILGGALSVPLFEKRKGGIDLPPPPPGFTGPTGAGNVPLPPPPPPDFSR